MIPADCEPMSEPSENDATAHAVLAVLLARHPCLVHVNELIYELVKGPQRPRLSEETVDDGIADLVSAGLAYRLGEFLLASYAAVRGEELSA